MKLIGNTILIEPLARKTKTEGGILLSERYQDDEKQWRVVAVGPGRIRRKKGKPDVLIVPEVEPGDCVLVEVGLGNRAVLPNGQFIVEADQVIAKWNPRKPVA